MDKLKEMMKRLQTWCEDNALEITVAGCEVACLVYGLWLGHSYGYNKGVADCVNEMSDELDQWKNRERQFLLEVLETTNKTTKAE